jgi:hypothetical protein
MEKVSALENYTKPFQIVGLQSFSLEDIEEQKSHQGHSLVHKIKTLILLVFGNFFAYFLYIHFHKTLEETNNSLEISVTFVSYVIFYFLLNGCIFLSFTKFSYMEKVFLTASNISALCVSEFNIKINYKRKRLGFSVLFLLFVLNIGYQMIYIFPYDYYSKLNTSRLFAISDFSVWYLMRITFILIDIRYWFYIEIVNLNLETLAKLVREKRL